MKAVYILLLCLLFPFTTIYAQNYPGGVTGAEVWYIADWNDLGTGSYKNSAQTNIKLRECGNHEKTLFNFNSSLLAKKLCIEFKASLENSTGRNAFFVGEPKSTRKSFSHLGTLWRDDFQNIAETDSIVRNFFDANDKNLYAQEILADYGSNKNAHVNFYHTNHYNIDKKFKSYGQVGETSFYIGKTTTINPDAGYIDIDFNGLFPEFISFPRELSNNERTRVESYLALKYGLTLNTSISYINSKNIVFWKDRNNKIFPNRVFGFGRDNVSGLHQLQSESTHLKKHLVAAVGVIMNSNDEKLKNTKIPNNHFLVFGDNGKKPALANKNNHGIKFWDKVWLAQRTGQEMEKSQIHFELQLTTELKHYFEKNPTEVLWLMQDKYISNNEVSDFSSESIEYYEGDIDFNQNTAYFKNVYFDSDQNIYDQFTFGVGPQMIVQALVEGCKKEKLEVTLDINGGIPPYQISVQSSQGSFQDVTQNNTYSFGVSEGVTYYVNVQDANSIVATVEFTPEPWGFTLDFGPTQYLSASQPEIILDAGSGITDPNATYQWYLGDVLLPNTESTLTVSQPGNYKVVVISGDLSCTIDDKITILSRGFITQLEILEGCDEQHNSLIINIGGGTPPFQTNLNQLGSTNSINYAHSGSTVITDIPYGTYEVTITDSVGDIFEDIVTFNAPPEGLGLDIYTQLEAVCDTTTAPCSLNYNYPVAPLFFTTAVNTFNIDASTGVNNPNMTYQWFQDGQPLGINQSNISFIASNDCVNGQLPIFTVLIEDFETNCTATQSFITRGFCAVINGNLISQPKDSETNESTLNLTTRVYPNPAEPNTNFTYEVSASEEFSGTVEIYTVTGVMLYNIEVSDITNYTHLFSIETSGMYFIRTTSSIGIVKTDRVIIK